MNIFFIIWQFCGHQTSFAYQRLSTHTSGHQRRVSCARADNFKFSRFTVKEECLQNQTSWKFELDSWNCQKRLLVVERKGKSFQQQFLPGNLTSTELVTFSEKPPLAYLQKLFIVSRSIPFAKVFLAKVKC